MGQVLAYLSSSKAPSDILIDFEGAKPNKTKSDTYEALKSQMAKGNKLLSVLQGYGNGGRKIRGRLMGCKDDDKAAEIFVELLQYVDIVKDFYTFAGIIGKMLPSLARELMTADTLEHQQAMVKLFADVLDFIRKFDTAKTYAPELQNDFAFFKRSLGKFGKHGAVKDKIPLTAQEASMVSLFLGPSGPMTTFLGDKCAKAFPKSPEKEQFIELVASVANILCTFVMQSKEASDGTRKYCLGAMTGAIVLYDYISSLDHGRGGGVFSASSKIQIKQCCKQIRGHKDLCACVRYSTKTYSASASDKIRGYLET